MKNCFRCKNLKPDKEFSLRGGRLNSWCKDCFRKYYKQKSHEWFVKNQDKVQERSNQWAKEHPERIKEIQKKSKIKHGLLTKERRRIYLQSPPGRYTTTVTGAKVRNLEFNLTFEEFCQITDLPCNYCGENQKPRGIDRVDNKIGYTIKNSVPCCRTCNFMKNIMTRDNFLYQVNKIHKWTKN